MPPAAIAAAESDLEYAPPAWPSRRLVVWLAMGLNCSLWAAIVWGVSQLV